MHYHFSYTNPNTHFFQVELTIDNIDSEQLSLHLPSWRPGRYEIANFAQRIKSIRAFDSNSNTLPLRKNSKDSWVLETGTNTNVKVLYEFYAFEMDAGNSFLDEEQLYLNFINCSIYVEDRLDEPCEIGLSLPDNYQCATGLQKVTKHHFSCPNYYRLVDSPLIASSTLRHIPYKANNLHFNIWIQGDLPKSNEELINDFARFTQHQIDIMEEFPCEDYHFLIQCLPYKHYHGVEHWNSTVITIGPSDQLNNRELYKQLLGVSSHELFHTWNVIRLRPREMTPYNFDQENYHKTGFITEGITTYYGDLFLVQSGVFSLEEYLIELNTLLKRHFENEGRKNMSVADSSYDLWLDGYKKGIPGRKVSIYNEGALAALILDLKIRLKWDHNRSLDDVMRLMWEKYGRECLGYTFEDYQSAAEQVFGESLDEYFNNYINGLEPFENALTPLIEACGLEFKLVESSKAEERNFGLRTQEGVIVQIASGSPAEQHLSLKDKIISVNRQALGQETVWQGKVTLKIERFTKMKEITLEVSEDSFFNVYQVKPASEIPNYNLKQWLNLK